MWKCKECGGTDSYIAGLEFNSNDLRYCSADFDKNGEYITYDDEDNRVYKDYRYCQCENCGLTGDTIQDIADWEEEDERD